MVPKFFGQYLLENRIISTDDLLRAIKYQEEARQKLGEIALSKGYLTKEQVDEINDLQKREDMMFGDLALNRKYLNKKQLDELITIQKNSHVYLGEALVHKNILTNEQVDKHLRIFTKDQKEFETKEISIPFDHKHKDCFEPFIDLTIKLLRRTADITAKMGKILIRDKESDTRYCTVSLDFTGDIMCKFMLSLSENAAHKIAKTALDEEIVGDDLVIDECAEFLNVVAGNVRTKLEVMGKTTEINVPHIILPKDKPNFKYEGNDKAIVVPLSTTEGYCELHIVLSDLNHNVGKKKVLIVDDSKSVAFKLKKVIDKMADFEVVGHAESGEAGIKMYKELLPDLVTMDIILPGISGIDTIKEIKRLDADANIVVISSVGGGQDKLFEAIQSGAKNVITKPFKDETIRDIFLQSI